MMRDDFDIHADGTIWVSGRNIPLLGITNTTTAAQAANATKRQAWAEIPADAYTRVGINANGLTVIKQSEYLAVKTAAITPAERERCEISGLYLAAHRLADSDSEDNVSGPMQLRGKADRLLAAWCIKYPAEAAKERRDALMSKAADLRDKASSAMLYDCDGSLSNTDQIARRDNFISQAEAIEAEAKTINS
jgi:hypothetical protein